MNRVTIVCGHYGVGKSECSVSLALVERARHPERPLTLIDLDVVNPYFRSREARARLESEGVTVIGNSLNVDTGVDLPAIPGTIAPALRDTARSTLIDLGGDPAGARALRQFRPHIALDDTDLLAVVNIFRPDTHDAAGVIASVRAIEDELSMPCTGLINNSHLLHETTCEHIRAGHAVCRTVAAELSIPIRYTAITTALADQCRAALNGEREAMGETLPIGLTLRQAWMNYGNQHTTRRE